MITQAELGSVESLEPAAVWQFFAGLAAVPRPSKREEKIRAHILQLAKHHGLTCREEAVGNIVIDVPASAGCENAPITVLQAHLDMVCEKNADVVHDFDQDPIHLLVQKDTESGEPIVCARGTTLGADNGMGVAMALAASTSSDVKRGPLELLFTIDEEDGMTGAKALTPSSVKGRRLLNLDSEEDDALYIGCAGGCDTNLKWNLKTSPVSKGSDVVRVTVAGLRGGHSGGDIHEGRGNAIKLLARVLSRAGVDQMQLVEITGGSKRNAIPRESEAVIAGPSGMLDGLIKSAGEVSIEGKGESFEENLRITAAAVDANGAMGAASSAETGQLLAAITALPCGVLGMHPKVDGLVETSNNVSTIVSSTNDDALQIEIGSLTRSSSDSRKAEALAQIAAVGRFASAVVSTGNEYPGWEPNADSPTLALCSRVYKELFQESPNVAAIHAGLECGIIGKRVGGMDMVSFGPTIRGAHSPDERVYVDSVRKSWNYLIAVLEALSE